jgi:hypothetical protein
MRSYEKPAITTMEGRELIEALGPAQANTSGGPGIGIGGTGMEVVPIPQSAPRTFGKT